MRKDDEPRQRTKQFFLRVIKLYQALPASGEARPLGNQVLRSGTSVAANCREASRGRSRAEVRSKLGIVEQEQDETMLRLELLAEAGVILLERLEPLIQETDELIRITVTSIKRLKQSE